MRAGFILVFLFSAFLDAGCSQGVGDRCVQNSDCSTGICSVTGQSAQGGRCLATAVVPTGTDAAATGGTGGSGGEAGQGGASGQSGQGGNAGASDAAAPTVDAIVFVSDGGPG